MRTKVAFFALLSLFPLIAAAQSSIQISPSQLNVGEAEVYLTITGNNLAGELETAVTYSGQAGTFQTSTLSATATEVLAAIPSTVLQTAGQWSVSVLAFDIGGTRVIGPATLTIIQPVISAPPLISVPEVVVAEATSAAGANVSFPVGGFSYVDPPPAPTVTCNHPSGSLFPLATTTVTCTATDSFGSTSASFLVVVADTTPPVLSVPAPFTSASQVVNFTVTATDNINGAVTPTCTPASGSTFPIGLTTVQCTAEDAHNNVGRASFQVSVLTPPAPALTLPGDFTAFAVSPTGDYVTFVVTSDQPEATIACTPESGSFFLLGKTTVTCTATNVFGAKSTGSFVVTLVPRGAPALTLPPNITAEATGATGAVVTYTATAFDQVDGPLPVTCTPLSGSTFPLGKTTVQCSATNSADVTTTGSFDVTVVDTTAPSLTLPADMTKEGDTLGGAIVTFTASATDVVDGTVSVTCVPASGATFPVGMTTVQCSATDAHGNSANGSFKVTVTDTTAPVLTLPASITAEATGPGGATVTYLTSAVDVVDGIVPVLCAPASGSTFPLGATSVQCSATDAHANTAAGSFTVTVKDTTAPSLTLPADLTVEATNASGAVVTFTATATDLVDGTVPVSCTPASGSTFPLGTTSVQCSATDAHGNKASGSFSVTVADTTPPQIVALAATPSTLWPPDHKMVDVTVEWILVDTVDPAPTARIIDVSSNQPVNGGGDGDTAPDWVITGPNTVQLRAERSNNVDRVYTITVEATDASGNTATSTVQVKVTQQRHKAAF